MRLKKQKRHRKTVRFFSACFGFREPFKVLCDGTFVHHLLLHGLTPADDAVSRLLASRATLFATRCAVAELGSLGDSHAASLAASRQLLTARCDHEKRVSAAACIEAVIGESNEEHFFVATQDPGLRRRLQQVPGVPLIYGLKNSLFLEKPSAQDLNFVKLSEEKRLHVGELEVSLLRRKKVKNELPLEDARFQFNGTTKRLDDDKFLVEESGKDMKKKKGQVNDGWQFKRKMAKGPNPLSCKKKKKNAKEDGRVLGGTGEDGSGMVLNKKRNRKRKRVKSGTVVE